MSVEPPLERTRISPLLFPCLNLFALCPARRGRLSCTRFVRVEEAPLYGNCVGSMLLLFNTVPRSEPVGAELSLRGPPLATPVESVNGFVLSGYSAVQIQRIAHQTAKQ